MTVIQLEGLSKSYMSKNVLNELNLNINGNKIIGLIGRNGVGKSTLLKIIAGFIKHSSGRVTVFDEEPFNNIPVSANSIFIDDEMVFSNALQLQEILKIAGSFYSNWDTEFANRLFQYFKFDPSAYHHRLSKGKRSTFNAIIGLASRASLTIFDEPTTGMDAAVRKDFYRALLKDYIANPRTIILSSHHLEEIDDLIEDVILLKDASTILHFDIDEFKQLAISFEGNNDVVNEWIDGKEVLYKRSFGNSQSYVVVKNNYCAEQLQTATKQGIKVAPVSASDTYVYLTDEKQGGIDNVFSND